MGEAILRSKTVLTALLAALGLVLFQHVAWAQTPGLSITKEGPATVEPGANFSYVLTVTNATATDTLVVVRDQLPRGLTFVSSEGARCDLALTDPSGRTVECDPVNVSANGRAQITLNVTAPSTAGPITNSASATSTSQANPTTPVNSNEVTTNVVPNLSIEKLDDPDPVSDVEDLLLYTIRVQNRGANPVSGVAITDNLPLDVVDFVEVESDDYVCQVTAGVVQCNAERAFGPGEISTVQIVVEPEVAGTIENTAALFVEGIRGPIETATETTTVQAPAVEDEDENPDNGNGNDDNGNDDNGDDSNTNDSDDDDSSDNISDDNNDVDRDTIPDKNLPDTGGTSKGVLVGAALLALFVGFLTWISRYRSV
ncbi:DUF11 domain-containing protein [Rubrobacter marinus]|uniref:DUF11 domain-containing protein n=1 Tax=Rubrobacter marinus TaxID=2653852 RepID=UPI001D191EB3|nr:DUF11 domain-containing protein [Rubrobacter marinus]